MQTLTPTSTITNTAWDVTGASAHAATADSSEATYCACNNTTNELELKFTTPSQTPLTGNKRFRLVLKGPGSVALRFMEGTTELQTASIFSLESTFQERFVILTATPSAWTDLRIEIIASASGVTVSDVFLDVPAGASDPTDRRDPYFKTGRVLGVRSRWPGRRRR